MEGGDGPFQKNINYIEQGRVLRRNPVLLFVCAYSKMGWMSIQVSHGCIDNQSVRKSGHLYNHLSRWWMPFYAFLLLRSLVMASHLSFGISPRMQVPVTPTGTCIFLLDCYIKNEDRNVFPLKTPT